MHSSIHSFTLPQVIARSKALRSSLLEPVRVHIDEWRMDVMKIKALYHTLNMFKTDARQVCMEGRKEGGRKEGGEEGRKDGVVALRHAID